MAFVYRAERDFSIKKDLEGTGPGQYVGHSEYKKRHGYAPFSSVTARNTMPIKDPTVAVPGRDSLGPGFYSYDVGFDEIKQKIEKSRQTQAQGLEKISIKLIQPSAEFASKVKRFAERKKEEKSPEPGDYNVQPSWETKTLKMRPARSEKLLPKFMPSPPSIPYKNTSNGY